MVNSSYQIVPFFRKSAKTASMPFLSIIRMPLDETRNRTQRFSLSTQNLWCCRLGRKRLLVLLLACDTLLPTTGRLPVTWHILVIKSGLGSTFNK